RPVVEDEPPDPVDIRLFGAEHVVADAQHLAHLIEQARPAGRRGEDSWGLLHGYGQMFQRYDGQDPGVRGKNKPTFPRCSSALGMRFAPKLRKSQRFRRFPAILTEALNG